MRVVYRNIVLKYQSLLGMGCYTFECVAQDALQEARYISTATLLEMILELEKHGYITSTSPDADVQSSVQ